MRPWLRPILAAFLAVPWLACGAGGDAVSDPGGDVPAAREAVSAQADGGSGDRDRRGRTERPLPAFGGWTLDGEHLEISSLVGKRMLLFFFNPEVPDAAVVARAVARISGLRGKQNFRIVGVATGSSREKAKSFAQAQGIDYPVIDDSSAAITRRLLLRVPVALIGVDAEGYVVFGLGQFATGDPHAGERIEEQLRTALRLPNGVEDARLVGRPEAPLFEGTLLDGGGTFRLADQRGRAVVLVFFLHTCPHCHEFLEFMKGEFAKTSEDERPVLIGVEVTGKTYSVRESLRTLGLDFFPVIFDDDGSIQADYGVFGGVPDIFLIDKEGRIAAHVQGWVPESDGPVLRMRIAKASGTPVPMLLRPKGYSGNEACSVCHESEHDTWLLTKHASAYDTLVKHGSESDGECVSCHVVGYGEAGGFEIGTRTPSLEDVGCESCHGPGGPHLSPQFVTGGSYESACLRCHDTKHSLGFEYASFVPRISHAANAAILALPPDERRRVLAERGAPRKDLLPSRAAYVGSDACTGCHEAEHATWAAGPHARAMDTLAGQGKQAEADCQRCHTTAFGRPGGFDAAAEPSAQADLARVGCESCHGPGGDHVAEGAKRLGTILSLGDKCDSCVILQICGTCHDDANDPGFEFEVQAKIDQIRHGTIEAGTGKPLERKGHSARAAPPGSALPELLSRAFAATEARGPEWTAR